MDKIEVLSSGVGYLTIAYFAGYPIYWFVGKPLLWLVDKVNSAALWMSDNSAKMDEDPYYLPWSRKR
jgi:hypothetical protein